jgi:hypothetical protein
VNEPAAEIRGILSEANENLGDFEQLSKRLEDDGYLLIRGLADPARVTSLKEDILALSRKHHFIEDTCGSEPLWSGGPFPTDAEFMTVYDEISHLESLKKLAESEEITETMEGLFGGPVQVWEQLVSRMIFPDPGALAPLGLGGHQDANPKFGYMVRNFYTCWVALMEIDEHLGGLALVPGSHKMGVLEHKGTLASSTQEARQSRQAAGIARDDFQWYSCDYYPGDAVIFTSTTVHRGLANRSDRIRLSCDFRYQARGEWANWMSHTPAPDTRRMAQAIDAIISSRALYVTTGASGEILEEVRRQMLQERCATLERAQELVAELRSSSSNAGVRFGKRRDSK